MILANYPTRRKIAQLAIAKHPDWSTRRLAKLTHLSRELIDSVRRRMAEVGTHGERPVVIGRDGKRYRRRAALTLIEKGGA